MISSQMEILQNVLELFEEETPSSNTTVQQTVPPSEILNRLTQSVMTTYLATVTQSQDIIDTFKSKIQSLHSDNVNETSLETKYVNHPYYTQTDYTETINVTISNTQSVTSPVILVLQDKVHQELDNLSTNQNDVDSSELNLFNNPLYSQYNTNTTQTYEDSYKSLYDKLHLYYSSYEPDKATQYIIQEDETPDTSTVDTYALLYQGSLTNMRNIIQYHDDTYSSKLDTFDTTSTIDTLTNTMENITYLTQNPLSISLEYGDASKYMTTNSNIIYNPQEENTNTEPTAYELEIESLFKSIPSLVPYND